MPPADRTSALIYSGNVHTSEHSTQACAMSLIFPDVAQSTFKVGQPPWLLGTVFAADAFVGLLGLDRAEFAGDGRVQGDPRRPGGLPHHFSPPRQPISLAAALSRYQITPWPS